MIFPLPHRYIPDVILCFKGRIGVFMLWKYSAQVSRTQNMCVVELTQFAGLFATIIKNSCVKCDPLLEFVANGKGGTTSISLSWSVYAFCLVKVSGRVTWFATSECGLRWTRTDCRIKDIPSAHCAYRLAPVLLVFSITFLFQRLLRPPNFLLLVPGFHALYLCSRISFPG